MGGECCVVGYYVCGECGGTRPRLDDIGQEQGQGGCLLVKSFLGQDMARLDSGPEGGRASVAELACIASIASRPYSVGNDNVRLVVIQRK